jgi:mRNA interferase MazF
MVTLADYVPQRGDLIWLTLNPQAGRRPAVALSHGSYNGLVGLAILCPVTSQAKGYPFEVALPEGLPVCGVILVDQMKSLDWRVRQAEYIGGLPADTMDDVMTRLAALLSDARCEAFFR